MTMRGYNGWEGLTRDIRGTRFYDKGFAKIRKHDTCEFCGQPNDGSVSLSYHAEDYGHTWEEYVQQCRRVCPRCHGMIHTRFKFPNRWERYKHRVREPNFGGFVKFRTMKDFFAFVGPVPDIKDHLLPIPTGIEWIDRIPMTVYSGPPKIATRLVDGLEIPDSDVYGPKHDHVKGVIIRLGVTRHVEFHQPSPGQWVPVEQGQLWN